MAVLRRLFTLALFLALCAGALFVWSVWQPHAEWGGFRQRLDDARLTGSVKTALGLNRELAGGDISVTSEDGVVTLRGTVAEEPQRRRAEEVALSVTGVRQVVNHLHVVPGAAPPPASNRSLGESLDDAALEMRVRLAFSLHRELKDVPMEVEVYRRRVTLKGTLPDVETRDTATRTVREIPGVAEVVDHTRVTRVAQPSDRVAHARAALAGNVSLAAHDLVVRQVGGHIIVEGTVRTRAERDLAGLLVESAVGEPIVNEITVRP